MILKKSLLIKLKIPNISVIKTIIRPKQIMFHAIKSCNLIS